MAEAGWQVPGLVPISVPSPSQEPHPHSGSFAIAGDQEGWNRGGGGCAAVGVLLWGGPCVSPGKSGRGLGASPGAPMFPDRQGCRDGQESARTSDSPVAQPARAGLMGHTTTGTDLMGSGLGAGTGPALISPEDMWPGCVLQRGAISTQAPTATAARLRPAQCPPRLPVPELGPPQFLGDPGQSSFVGRAGGRWDTPPTTAPYGG